MSKSVLAAAKILISTWIPLLGLIFGGCCSNVFTFEKILSECPKITHLVTFIQFLCISIEGYSQNADFKHGVASRLYLKPRQVPLSRWFLHVVFFFVTSNMNNYAAGLDISIPIHVIFRSLGTIFTMIIGALFVGKKYNLFQTISGMALTLGLVLTTFGNSQTSIETSDFVSMIKHNAMKMSNFRLANLNLGITLLVIASALISINGFLTESTYKNYKTDRNAWKESLFYQHALALPFFLIFKNQIHQELLVLLDHAPQSLYYLVANVLTQYICVRGVNKLSSETNLLTVSVILLLRKFTSLLLSILFFNNTLNRYCWTGTGLIFCGAFLYSYGSNKRGIEENEKKQK